MQVNIREDVNFAPNGDRVNWPYAGEYLARIELVEQLGPCDGTAMHYVHLCAEKWGAFIIAIAAGFIPLSPEADDPVYNTAWDVVVRYNPHRDPATLRDIVRWAGTELPRFVDL